MASRALKILLIFDMGRAPPADHDYSDFLKDPEWESEAGVARVLKKLGHEVRLFGIYNDIDPFFDVIKSERPDLVFNLCEAFQGNRDFEANIVSLLELYGIKYTGAGSFALQLCKDKGLTKKILSYHRVRIPHFIVSRRSHPVRRLHGMNYPAFIKPLGLEASEGIAQMSFAEDEASALERIGFIHARLGVDAIVEEYIEGREIYVGVFGNDRPVVLPPRELFFKEVPEGEPKFATFKAKWDDAYRKRWGIRSGIARDIDPVVLKRMTEMCKKVYRLFEIQGYARIDLRLKDNGECVFIEVNPNPSIAREDDFAQAAQKSGVGYEDLISRLVNLGQ